MNIKEIKTEIKKTLDNVPESALQEVLNYLKMIEHQPTNAVDRMANFRQILKEDKTLLERLAK
jgi:hypothetical protein